jgi:predicted Zn-dependent peptidase
MAIFVNAGSRHESSSTRGAAAYLKAAAFQVSNSEYSRRSRYTTICLPAPNHLTVPCCLQSNADLSSFALTREAEKIGAKFSVHTDRDLIAYFAVVPRHNARQAASMLTSAVTSRVTCSINPMQACDRHSLLGFMVQSNCSTPGKSVPSTMPSPLTARHSWPTPLLV